jgi:predicted ABC-type transport system involved in lysophospholipase L1 biosynthesis ATPase subunit
VTVAPAALLEAERVRVDANGVPMCEGLTVRAQGRRVVLAGAGARAIAAALGGTARLVSGALRVGGREVGRGEHLGWVGVAAIGAAMPSRERALDWVAAGYRLCGVSRREAVRQAQRVLADLGVGALGSRTCGGLAPPERRAVALAQAMLPGAGVLFAPEPLAALEGPAAQYVLHVLGNASRSRSVLATAARADAATPERELLLGADFVALLGEREASWTGTPAELLAGSGAYALCVRGEADRLVGALMKAGIEIRGGPPRLCVRLPEGAGTETILEAARASGCVVIEMIPLVGPG